MVYSLTYRRPAHVFSPRSSVNGELKPKSLNESVCSGSTSIAYGIPDALAFDRIISGGTCPPCTTRDFMNYLIYIEHAAENLQFFLWFRDYSKRFSGLPQAQRTLAPEWTAEQAEAEALLLAKKNFSAETAASFKGTDFAPLNVTVNEFGGNPLSTPPRTPMGSIGRGDFARSQSDYGWSDDGSTLKSSKKSFRVTAAGAFEAADIKWEPFTTQPFREEISRIIAAYVADGAPRQLNLSSKERTGLLHALANTTHPSAFLQVVHTIEWSLRHQAHPNFIRWTICNANRPRVIFARGLAIASILGGIITAILIALSSAGRGWRVISAVGFFIGISTGIAAWKGMCIVLHGMHHRHLRPWELFSEDDDDSSVYEIKKGSFDSVSIKNSYEDEPWVIKYEKRNVLRKIFDREVWIQEPALRQIQDTIFIQALAASFILTAILVGIFCALPKGNFY
ncbi:MAG: regulator of g signaling superfamily [Lasallia pustulata]|uniref:Regulator of g signaling superfamily n=1 Tax=Lasallia pustulata TaxID=136370 RepID=A0A5M8PZ24_9LECA|nr:MAG: regulator of g signaling superfamily [Lasallia pustulata]